MLKLPVKSPIVNGDIDLSEYAKKSDVDAIDASLDNKADKKEVEKISSQLDTIEQDKVESNYLFKRKIIGEFPLCFEDYNQIVSDEKIKYIYPQSFAIDDKTNELFVLYSPESTIANGKRWIAVYDIETKKYKSCFQAGNAGGEGIVIKYENTERYLYIKTTGTNLGKFLINTLPINKSTLTPISEYNVGLHWQFSYGDGYWYIEQSGATLGQYIRRNIIAKYDDNFNKIGELYIDSANIGFFNSSYCDYVSKRQGFTIHNGNFVFGMGGCYKTGTLNIPFSNYGLRILNMKGENIQSAIIKSDKFIELLQLENIPCTRIENEGVYSINDKLYSMCITLGPNDNQANKSGIIIFEEMSNNDYLDCSNISASDITFNKEAYENSNFPRSNDGQLYNPITGVLIDTMDKMLDFMINVDLRSTSFYSSSSSLQWFNGDTIPNAHLVKIENCNNSTFNIEIKGNKDIKRYWVYGTSGSRTVKQVINDYAKKSDVDAIGASIDNKAEKKDVEELSSQLDTKANYEYVNNQISIAQLEGAGVDTSSFLTRNDLDYLLIKSINKFNPKGIIKDKYLTRGVLTDYAGWNTTDYIRISGNKMSCKVFKTSDMTYVQGAFNTWVEVNNIYYAFYDSLYNYIPMSGSTDTGSFLNEVTIPENAKFIRFSTTSKILNDSSTLMFSFDDLSGLKVQGDYQKYSVMLDGSDYINSKDLKNNIDTVKKSLSRSVTVKSINRLGYDVYNPNTPPEHSLEGYKLAIDMGFDEILCDLRSTSDSVPVCLHDATINRTARNIDGTTLPTINILDITYDQANSYDYGLYKDRKYKGTKLLTLERIVKFAKMNGVTLHIETKCGTSETELKMIENAVRIVKKYNMSKFVSWSNSYSGRNVMKKVTSLDKYARVALMPDVMTNERFDALLELKTGFNKVFWFAWETSSIDDDMLNRFINNDIELEIGTFNNAEEMKKLFNSNLRYVTAISSDKLVARECLK